MGEINIEIDGIWCPECRMLHRTLRWHDKYDDWLMNRREEWEKIKKKLPALVGDAVYVDKLPALGLEEMSEPMACNICGSLTHFRDSENHIPVCSDKCHDEARETK